MQLKEKPVVDAQVASVGRQTVALVALVFHAVDFAVGGDARFAQLHVAAPVQQFQLVREDLDARRGPLPR